MTTHALARGLRKFVVALINILPGSPFVYLEQTGFMYKYLRMLNWIIPIDWMLATLSAWLLVVGVYQLWQTGLRWFKVIE